MSTPEPPRTSDDFPGDNLLSAMGAVEAFITAGSAGETTIKFGWFEDSGSGGQVHISTDEGAMEQLDEGVHDVKVSSKLMILGTPGQGGKLVLGWSARP